MSGYPVDLQLSSGRVRVLRWGAAAGAPAVCVPGLSANARSFDAIADDLARRGSAVYALDLRGRGFSPATAAGTHGWSRHALDVVEAAGRLGLGAFDLIGHSMGAFVAMHAAVRAPDRIRRLVLIDAVGVPEPTVIPPILAAVQRLGVVHPSAEAYCELIRRHSAAEPWEELWKQHYLYELEPVPSGVRPRTSIDAVLEDVAYAARQNPALFWPRLTMPTLLVRAARPLLEGTGFVVGAASRDAFLAAAPRAVVVEVDANHYGVMAHPQALRAIADFLIAD
jgi:3-oxoadipate enol-lactonase